MKKSLLCVNFEHYINVNRYILISITHTYRISNEIYNIYNILF